MSSRPQSTYHDRSSGFTLVEVLVAIALFSILVSIASGGFVQALRSERQVSAMMSSESNASIALEEMTREMRTGYLFCHDTSGNVTCPACVSDGAQTPTWTCPNFIEFYNANGNKIDYILDSNGLERAVDGGTPEPLMSSDASTTFLGFTIFGNQEGDRWNPRVTVTMSVEPNNSTISWPTVNLQTTVSSRNIDCSSDPAIGC